MKINTIDVATGVLVTYTLVTSPLIGIGFLGYVLHTNKKIKNLEAQVRASIQETEEVAMLTKNLENVLIDGNVSNYDNYKDCIIDNYQNRFFRIMKPSGEYLEKIFTRLEDAKREIDTVTPFLKKIDRKYGRRRVYNIRYVK